MDQRAKFCNVHFPNIRGWVVKYSNMCNFSFVKMHRVLHTNTTNIYEINTKDILNKQTYKDRYNSTLIKFKGISIISIIIS